MQVGASFPLAISALKQQVPGSAAKLYATQDDCYSAVLRDEVDVCVDDSLQADWAIKQPEWSELIVAGEDFWAVDQSIAISRPGGMAHPASTVLVRAMLELKSGNGRASFEGNVELSFGKLDGEQAEQEQELVLNSLRALNNDFSIFLSAFFVLWIVLSLYSNRRRWKAAQRRMFIR
jgi:hypothetical protein